MKKIKGFENYSVTKDGKVYSHTSRKFLTSKRSNHYERVALCKDGKVYDKYIHRLVAEHFVDGRNETVNHKDGNKFNNHASNLEWVSMSDNNKHATDMGLRKKSFKHNQFDRRKIAAMYETGKYASAHLGKMFGVSPQTILNYVNEFKEGKDRL